MDRRTGVPPLSLLLLAPLALPLLAPSGAAAAEPVLATCQGREVTIVGSPGELVLRGTPGDDVILSNGSGSVEALGGDDVVCLTSTRSLNGLFVELGPGDDHAVVVERGVSAFVRGGIGDDVVEAGLGEVAVVFSRERDRAGVDRVVGGRGSDSVGFDRIGPPSVLEADLGGGRDTVDLDRFGVAAGSTLDGGTGADVLDLGSLGQAGDYDVDVATGTATRNGVALVPSFVGFERFSVDLLFPPDRARPSVRFRGTDADERLVVLGARRVDVAMGGGDDFVGVNRAGALTGRIDGGGGRDRIAAEVEEHPDRILLDLGRRYLGTVPGSRNRDAARVVGFEDADIDSTYSPGVLVGDGRDNRLRIGCGVARGGGGADLIRSTETTTLFPGEYRPATCASRFRSLRIEGGAGPDRIVGSRGPDVLLGGAGRDRVDGLAGRDRCRAEVRRSC